MVENGQENDEGFKKSAEIRKVEGKLSVSAYVNKELLHTLSKKVSEFMNRTSHLKDTKFNNRWK